MITENELRISNESYINKDFDSVYRELITIAKNISSRLDVSNSNESDPFIVLLKLAAFAVDKTNYTSDKNLLERFLLSATQEESVADITSRLGYDVQYYNAAKTTVRIEVSKAIFSDSLTTLTIPRNVMFGTESGDITYTTTDPFNVNYGDTIQSVTALECSGGLKTLQIMPSISSSIQNETIRLSNLDENNRIYFPESMVAQNGIFITGGVSIAANSTYTSDSLDWRSCYNLNEEVYGSLVYKFGYDSFRKLPYIEFPYWISSIIGDGLTIKYIVCSGSAGNIKARYLTKINSLPEGIDIEIKTDDFTVTNLSASYGGADPETINQTYNNFKKTIGTFETLVTCRDYANKIYNLLSLSGKNYVSNIQVSDRRSDINYNRSVIEYNDYGVQMRYIPPKTTLDSNSSGNLTNRDDYLTANELRLYALNPITNLNFEKSNKSSGYDNTYSRLLDTSPIQQRLQEEKYLCHDFKDPVDSDIILIKNLYKLNIVVYTTYKVNGLEAASIIANINQSLAENFNSRELDFGYAIPIDTLQSVIQNADPRIKIVSLNIVDQTIEASIKYGNFDKEHESITKTVLSHTESSDWYKFVTAQNILSGRVELFDYDNMFIYDYGQQTNQDSIVKEITSISSYPFGLTDQEPNKITLSSDQISSYTLKQNEVIQIALPSLDNNGSTIYPYPVKYKFTGFEGTKIASGIYKLGSNQTLSFSYTKNDSPKIDPYGEDTIFEVNTDIELHDDYYYIPQGTEISIRKLNEVCLASNILCYWFTNSVDNEIKFKPREDDQYKYDYVLSDNEMFFYTDTEGTYLAVAESGTKLTLTSPTIPRKEDWTISNAKELDKTKILVDGLESILDKFISKNFYVNPVESYKSVTLTLLEQKIINLTQGDQIKLSGGGVNVAINPNYFIDIPEEAEIQYLFSDAQDWVNLDTLSISGYNRSIRALLDINCGPEYEQVLEYPQTIIVKNSSGTTTICPEEIGNSKRNILFSITEQLSGGEDLNPQYNDIFTSKSYYPDLYQYTYTDVVKSDPEIIFEKQGDRYYRLFGKQNRESPDGTIEITLPNIPNEKLYFMCYVDSSSINGRMQVYFTGESGSSNVKTFNDQETHDINTWIDISVRDESKTLIFELENVSKMKFKKESSLDDSDETSENDVTESDPNDLDESQTESDTNDSDESLTESDSNINSDYHAIISYPRLVKGLNPLLGLKLSNASDNSFTDLNIFINYMKNENRLMDQFSKFYCINYIDKDKAIEISEDYKLNSSEAFFDYNNIANKWTISKLDFENSEIKIAETSRKR